MGIICLERTNIWYKTRSQVRSSGIRLPEMHGAHKGLDPHVQPGKQKSFPIQTINKGMPTHPIPKPRIGQVEQD